ncbi:MAG: 16S rRNA (guanine(527)-N(7))-methyltransferase RsmG, partial [Rubrobacteraceae bacterium]
PVRGGLIFRRCQLVSRETIAVIEVEIVKRQAEAWGVRLGNNESEVLLRYARQLGDYREANIVGTRDASRLLIDHVLDSLSCLLSESVRRERELVDIGSGGGLPGIPLKIVRPDLALTLVEATGKKARFLEQVVGELTLDGTEVVNERAETLGHEQAYRGKYNVATARALAPLSTLCEYCLPLVRKGGCLVAMKAAPDKNEIEAGRKAAKVLGAEISDFIEVEFIPELPAKRRCLVVMGKVEETPMEYPRRAGVPKKNPLGNS